MTSPHFEAPRKIEPLTLDDLDECQVILNTCNLPSEDVEAHIRSFIGIRDGSRLIAVGGLEVIESDALLRSVAVVPEYREQGLAKLMVDALIKQALQSQINSLYLLTETATSFFEKMRFELIARNDVPEKIRGCRQFTSLCPDSADCLSLKTGQYAASVNLSK